MKDFHLQIRGTNSHGDKLAKWIRVLKGESEKQTKEHSFSTKSRLKPIKAPKDV